MELPVNHFKSAIKAGRPQIGIWSSLCSYISAEGLADAGFDWVLLDTEHSPNELPMVQNQLDALAYGKGTTEGIVRPAWNDIVLIKRYLDVGARTLLIAYVQNVEEARRAVTGLRYPPGGMRGVSGTTLYRHGLSLRRCRQRSRHARTRRGRTGREIQITSD